MRPFGLRILLWGTLPGPTGPLIYSWRSNAGSSAWATDTNWDPNVSPSNDLISHVAIFSKASYTNQPNAGTRSVRGIDIGDGATTTAALTLSGTSLSVGTYGVMMYPNAGTATISSPLSLQNDTPVENDSNSLLTVSGGITSTGVFKLQTLGSGRGGITLSGIIGNGTGTTSVESNHSAQILTMSGVNTFTGGLLIKGGVVYGITSGSCFGVGNITIGDSTGAVAELGINGALTIARPVIVGGTGTNLLTFTTTGGVLTGGITTNQPLRITSTPSGGSSITTTAITGSGNLIFNGQRDVSSAITVSSAISTSGSITINGIGKTTLSGVVSNVNNIVINGIGQLSGNNTYTGTTTVNNGGYLSVSGSANCLGTSTLSLLSGSTFSLPNAPLTITNPIQLSGAISHGGGLNTVMAGSITLLSNVTIFLRTSSVTEMSGTISGGFSLSKTGTGDITLSGNDNYTGGLNVSNLGSVSDLGTVTLSGTKTTSGPTVITGGIVTVSSASALGIGPVTISNGRLDINTNLTTNNTLSITGDCSINGTSSFGSGAVTLTGARVITMLGDITFAGVIGGTTSGLTLRGSQGNELRITNSCTFSGGIILDGGAINVGNSTATGSLTSQALTLGGGQIRYTRTGTNTQTFTSTTLKVGHSSAHCSVVTATLQLNTISRVAGALLHCSSVVGAISVSNSNDATGIVGPWCTSTSNQYATISAGNITNYTGGTAAANATNLTDTTGTVNYDLAAIGSAPATMSCHTIRYTGAAGTLAPGATSFTVNGILNTTGAILTVGTNPITIGAFGELCLLTAGTGGLVISSPINGTGDITLGNISSGVITLSGSINPTGKIYVTGTSTATHVISGGIGSNVNEIVIARSNLSVTTNPITVNASGTTLKVEPQAEDGSLTFCPNSVRGITVSGGITGSGNFTISIGSFGSTSTFGRQGTTLNDTLVISTTAVNNTGTLTNNGTGSSFATISAVVGTNITQVIQDSATSKLVLSGANTWSGGLLIRKGGVELEGSSSGGTGSITLGDTSGSIDTYIEFSHPSGTITNPITIASGNTGIARLGVSPGGSCNYAGAITLSNHNLVISGGGDPNFAGVNSGTNFISGGITGTGNISLICYHSASHSFTTNPINHIGSISNDTPNYTPSDTFSNRGVLTFTSVIGSNVTSVSQNSTQSKIVLSTTNTYTGPTTITAGYLEVSSGGSINASSAVAVNGGSLIGAGTVGGTVTVANTIGATIKGGSDIGNLVGTLTIGNLIMSGANSGLDVEYTTAASLVSVTGTVALGGCRVNLLSYMPPGQYTILSSTGAMTGTLPVIGTNNSLRSAVLSQSGNNLILTLT